MNAYRITIPAVLYVTVHAKNQEEARTQGVIIGNDLNTWDYLAQMDRIGEIEGVIDQDPTAILYMGKNNLKPEDIGIEDDEGPVEYQCAT